MLFETANRKAASRTATPISRPVQQRGPATKTSTSIRTGQSNVRTTTPRTTFTGPSSSARQPLKSMVYPHQAPRRSQVTTTSSHPQMRRGYITRTIKPGQKVVTGWPSYRQGVRRPVITATARPGQRIITGWPSYRYGRPVTSTTVRPGQPQRIYGVTGAIRPGQRPVSRGTYYYPGQGPGPYYYRGSVQPPVYTGSIARPQGQRVAGGDSYYPYCPPAQTIPQQQQQPVCHTCGSRTRGCTTLSGFAFNSSQLSSQQINQIKALASRILQRNKNAVVATGHTDRSGTENYNEALGTRRAAAVVKELRRQLAMLRPGTHKNLFWKINSRGETRPISQNPATNRRVEICLRKVVAT